MLLRRSAGSARQRGVSGSGSHARNGGAGAYDEAARVVEGGGCGQGAGTDRWSLADRPAAVLALGPAGVLVAGAPLTSSGESPGGVTETFSAKAAMLIQMHRPARRRAR